MRLDFNRFLIYVMLPTAFMLLVWGCLWGPGVYQRSLTAPLANDTLREQTVRTLAAEIRAKSKLKETPELLITVGNRGTISVSEPFSRGFIAFSEDIFQSDSDFNESDVAAIIAHEIAHLEAGDTYKIWKSLAPADWWREIELVADKRAAELAGCVAVRNLFSRHYEIALKGWENKKDPHPHPGDRIKAAGKCAT